MKIIKIWSIILLLFSVLSYTIGGLTWELVSLPGMLEYGVPSDEIVQICVIIVCFLLGITCRIIIIALEEIRENMEH